MDDLQQKIKKELLIGEIAHWEKCLDRAAAEVSKAITKHRRLENELLAKKKQLLAITNENH